MRMAGRFSRRLRAWAKENKIPMVYSSPGERKHGSSHKGYSRIGTLIAMWCFFLLCPSSDKIAFHIELVLIFMRNSEAEPFIQSTSRINSYYIQTYCKIERSRFANQSLHYLRADALALKPTVHKHLRDKHLTILPGCLHPAYIRTVDHDDTNLR
jgi:hypothetical protein